LAYASSFELIYTQEIRPKDSTLYNTKLYIESTFTRKVGLNLSEVNYVIIKRFRSILKLEDSMTIMLWNTHVSLCVYHVWSWWLWIQCRRIISRAWKGLDYRSSGWSTEDE